MKKLSTIILFAALWLSEALAAVPRVDTRNGIFDSSFRTLQVHVDGNELAPPVIMLNSGDEVTISFDELSDSRSYLRYSLQHCDAGWQPSGLVDSEFLAGFNEGEVEDWDFSDATTVNYVHYSVTLPNDKVRFTVSGNYLLRVYREEAPDVTLLQARFSVSEGAVRIGGDVTTRTDVDYNGSHQQLSLKVDVDRLPVHNIYTDLKVVVTQNGRDDNKVVLTAPQRVAGNAAYYEHLRSLIFPAGNEYRRFEIVSTYYPGMRVAEIAYAAPFYHERLYDDEPRREVPFTYDRTQNGRFVVREFGSDHGDTAADYVVTHFNLLSPPLPDYDIYIDGDMTCRRFSPESAMHYDSDTQSYKASMLLKQGSYNYQYLAVPKGADRGVTSVIEGDFYPTLNEYLVQVYYRAPGSRYDRLLGTTLLFSGQ